MSLLTHKLAVAKILNERAAENQVMIHRFVNMGNHLHILLSFKQRKLMQKFMRVVTGMIARHVTRAKRGHAFGKRFWDYIAHTRIITGRKDYESLMHYFDKNDVERENGSAIRAGVELHDEITKIARRRNVPREVVSREIFRKRYGAGEIITLSCDD